MLSRTAVHALRAAAVLAELAGGQFAGAADVAAQIHAPPNYLGKLLRQLADAGIVESQKGKGGGFRLARDAAELSVYDVVEPIDHVSRWQGCFLGRRRCGGRDACEVHRRWGVVRDSYLAFLRETTLATLNAKSAETAAHR